MTIGVLIAFIQYAQRFFRPIQDLSDKFNILQAAMAASERIFKLLDTGAEIVSPIAACRRATTGSATGTHRVPQRLVHLPKSLDQGFRSVSDEPSESSGSSAIEWILRQLHRAE